MPTNISIPIPKEVNEEESDFDLVAYFQRLINSDFGKSLDTDVWEQDERAQVYEIKITDVEIQESLVHVTYNVLFEAYYGCKDQNYAGKDERTLTGTRVGTNWTFAQHTPRQPRSTFDEF